jgi:hypothetical protein
MRGAVLLASFASLAIAAFAPRADAHQTSVKYVDVTIEGRQATVKLTVAPGDVTEPLGLPPDGRPSAAEATTPGVAAYVAGWLALGPDDRSPCPAAAPRVHPDPDARFVVVEWEVVCAGDLGRLVLDLRAFFRVDQRHEAIVTVHAPNATGDAAVVRATDPILRVHAGEDLGLAAWIAAGIAHIWDGRDHICFVLALLLVVMLVREGDRSHGGGSPPRRQPGGGPRTTRWTTRGPLATLRHTATIVTAFTIAHSLSLIAASLGWVSLPGRLVESLIAFSILYTALENIVRPDVRWRFAMTFGFGLMHGLGFASVLQVMLPPDHIIAPLLGFNLGVEVGQLVIVAIALPVFWLLARELGAERYRRRVLPALSIVIALIAIKWLIERAFDIGVVTLWGM